jgi:hypothetical protein
VEKLSKGTMIKFQHGELEQEGVIDGYDATDKTYEVLVKNARGVFVFISPNDVISVISGDA